MFKRRFTIPIQEGWAHATIAALSSGVMDAMWSPRLRRAALSAGVGLKHLLGDN